MEAIVPMVPGFVREMVVPWKSEISILFALDLLFISLYASKYSLKF
ncbi:MAG: hypothetical protein R2942_14815 [Ignavibacteria bacterium]